MDELDLIRSFRADVPGPSDAATARAESAWRPTERRRISSWAPRLAAGTAAVAAVAAAALVVPSGDEGRLGALSAKAAQTLRQAAAEVHGLSRALKPGEYWYARTKTIGTTAVEGKEGAYTAMGLEVREEWIAADGTRRWTTQQAGPIRFPSTQDRDRWEADGRPDLTPPSSDDRVRTSFFVGTSKYTYRQILTLPRDPQRLYERFRDAAVGCRCGNGVDDQTFVVAVELLRTTPLPADLRAAILRAMALVPGIEQHAETDILGRPGVGVAYNGSQGRQALIFDPSTYEMLGMRGDRGSGTADLQSGIVKSMTARP